MLMKKTKFLWGWMILIIFVVATMMQMADAEEKAPMAVEVEESMDDAVLRNLAADGADKEKLHKSGETHHFQTEVSRMMKLIVNSLYKTKEIFLRELISNASDAIDKIRFMSLTDIDILGEEKELKIWIRADKERKILTLRDSGIGMTKEDLSANLGTIAKSGTSEFLANAEEKGMDSGLIGQFGVGFYSVFLVADMVTVTSKHPNDTQHIWASRAESEFSIYEDPRGNTLGRGTQIDIHLKEDALEYIEEKRLKELITRYSEFIHFPIMLFTTRTEKEEVPVEEEDLEATGDEEKEEKKDDAAADEKSEESDEEQAEVEDDKEEPKPKTKTIEKTVEEYTLINSQQPIWTRDPKEISQEDYDSFYKAFTKEPTNPMAHIHFKTEGEIDFRSIIYIPERADPKTLQGESVVSSIKLYVRKVFITDELADFVPRYLSFIRGLVDSDDIPLNVSRETLQASKLLKIVKKKVISKALEMIRGIAKKGDDAYSSFYEQYATNIKLGVIQDTTNRKKLTKLLRFHSSESKGGKLVSLDDYVSRMKQGQESIFFMAGTSVAEIKASPFVEKLLQRGYEVLYFSEAIDEYLAQSMPEYEKKKLQNVAKDGLKFGDEDEEDKASQEELQTRFQPLADWMKGVLSEYVEKVTVSNRLTTSPCAIVANAFAWSGNMERIMGAQAFGNKKDDPMANFMATQKKILEINPYHPLLVNLLERVSAGTTSDNTEELVHVLYESTALHSGYGLKETAGFSDRVQKMLSVALEVDPTATVEQPPLKPAKPIEKIEESGEREEGEEETESNAEGTEEDLENIITEEVGDDISHDEL